MKYKILFLFLMIAGLTGCREKMPDTHDPRMDNIDSWSQAFESFWNGVNYNYAFWSIDPTDWDAVYVKYKPEFEALDESDLEGEEESRAAYNMFEELSSTLIDLHMLVVFKQGEGYMFRPGYGKVKERSYFHENNILSYLARILPKMKDENRLTEYKTGNEGEFTAISGIIDGNIVYFYFSSFELSDHYGEPANEDGIAAVLENYYYLLDNHQDIKGVVIDVRGNGGGSLSDLDLVLGRFVQDDHVIGYTRYKNGMGRLDYTPWAPAMLHPKGYNRKLNVPIVALADLHSASMAEMTTMSILSMPNGCFVGERTMGANGPLIPTNDGFESFYSGSWENSAMFVRTSTCMMKDVNGVNHEGVGVSPTIEVLQDVDQLEQLNDTQLERAIEYIRTGK